MGIPPPMSFASAFAPLSTGGDPPYMATIPASASLTLASDDPSALDPALPADPPANAPPAPDDAPPAPAAASTSGPELTFPPQPAAVAAPTIDAPNAKSAARPRRAPGIGGGGEFVRSSGRPQNGHASSRTRT